MVLLPHLKHKDDASYVVEKIHQALDGGITVQNQLLATTVSIGSAVYPEDGQTVEELSEHADAAMYLDKRSRKDCVQDNNMELLTAG